MAPWHKWRHDANDTVTQIPNLKLLIAVGMTSFWACFLPGALFHQKEATIYGLFVSFSLRLYLPGTLCGCLFGLWVSSCHWLFSYNFVLLCSMVGWWYENMFLTFLYIGWPLFKTLTTKNVSKCISKVSNDTSFQWTKLPKVVHGLETLFIFYGSNRFNTMNSIECLITKMYQ